MSFHSNIGSILRVRFHKRFNFHIQWCSLKVQWWQGFLFSNQRRSIGDKFWMLHWHVLFALSRVYSYLWDLELIDEMSLLNLLKNLFQEIFKKCLQTSISLFQNTQFEKIPKSFHQILLFLSPSILFYQLREDNLMNESLKLLSYYPSYLKILPQRSTS